MKQLKLIILLLVLFPAVFAGKDPQKERTLEITGNLVCTCGCANIIVRYCDCGQAADMTKEAAAMVAANKSDDEIFAAFEKKYGKKVRGAPKAEGFNVLAWVLPFVGLLAGGVIVLVVVKRLRTPAEEEKALAESPEIDEKYRKRLDEELEED